MLFQVSEVVGVENVYDDASDVPCKYVIRWEDLSLKFLEELFVSFLRKLDECRDAQFNLDHALKIDVPYLCFKFWTYIHEPPPTCLWYSFEAKQTWRGDR